MAESDFEGTWKVLSSTSRFFSLGSVFVLSPKQGEPDSFELEVNWEKQKTLKLLDQGFLKVDRFILQGSFGHPREDPKEGFELTVALRPASGRGGLKRLFGLLVQTAGRIEGGGIGVWVAEEPPKGPPDRRRPRKPGRAP